MPGTRVPARRLLSGAPTATTALGALALAAVALGGCAKFDYLPDNPIQGWSPPVVLMHRGGGDDCGSTSTVPCWPNTLPAVLHGFETLDGAEVDIQITVDGTLWLGHDNEVLDCAGNPVGGGQCFQDLHDGDIDAVAYCDGTASCTPDASNSATCIQHYVRAEEVFQGISGVQPEKMISLDIKGQYCKSLGVEDARHMADEVDRLVRAYDMGYRVMAETSQLEFLDPIVSKGTPIYTFVVSLGDVDGPLGAAAHRHATGISFKWAPESEPMNASVVAGIHGKGYRIILWTIDAPADIAAAWASAPDVIETDAPDFFQHVSATP
jgi:glycerophosphoryl diester phosphodiesterase